MSYQMIPKSLLDELTRQAMLAPVIEINDVGERRAPIVIDVETQAELAMKAGGIEIKHGIQTVVLSFAVLDFIQLFRQSHKRRG